MSFCKFFLIVTSQGPTVSPVFCKRDGKVVPDYYAVVICVPKKELYKSVQQLRAVSNISTIHYIFWIVFPFYDAMRVI